MKLWVLLLSLCMLCGCAVSGISVSTYRGMEETSLKVMDQMIYNQAAQAIEKRVAGAFAVHVEQASGAELTLLFEEDGQMNRLIVHGANYTQWIVQDETRILCLTGDDGIVKAKLLDNLSAYGDLETIIECIKSPMELVKGRSFQRTSGQEEGSFQIATDTIDYWMKLSSDQNVEAIRLYLSDVPMMTLTYLNEIPVFPNVKVMDYPMYSDLLTIDEQILLEHDFIKEDVYHRETKKTMETLSFDEKRLDYTMDDEKMNLVVVYDELELSAVVTDKKTLVSCALKFENNQWTADEKCTSSMIGFVEKTVNNLLNEMKRKD